LPYLPQLAELKIPWLMDVAGGFLLYHASVRRAYLADAQNFRAAWDIFDPLPQRQLSFEMLVRQEPNACK
jgi:hypothetical protein